MTPHFALPKGTSMSAHFHVTAIPIARTSSRCTAGLVSDTAVAGTVERIAARSFTLRFTNRGERADQRFDVTGVVVDVQ